MDFIRKLLGLPTAEEEQINQTKKIYGCYGNYGYGRTCKHCESAVECYHQTNYGDVGR